MTAAEIAKEFAGYIGSDDPEWVAKLGNRLQERIEALVAGEVSEAKACVQRLAGALKPFLDDNVRIRWMGDKDGRVYVAPTQIQYGEAAQVLASIPAHLLAKEESKP